MNPPPTKHWRTLRRCLVGLAVCLTLIGLFYTEELWRGKRAWENCKRALEAQGFKLDWANYIPAPVPDDQNVFGVPEMQKWFTGRGATELSTKLSYPGYGINKTTRLVLAELTIALPGTDAPTPSGATALHWGDPQAQAAASRLIKDALGPVALNPLGFDFMLRSPEEIRPARILLQCQTAPTVKELVSFVPARIAGTQLPDTENILVEPFGNSSYKVTMLPPDTTAEFLSWSAQLEPEFTLIRKALQRSDIRMQGDYNYPPEIPIPNFNTVRLISQMLATMAQCHLVEGKPEEALRDLTLVNDLCRIETNQPITLIGAMINVAVRGLYVNTMADGLRWQAWREPQLAALAEQLQQINVLPPVKQAIECAQVHLSHSLETATSAKMAKWFDGIQSPEANSWTAVEKSIGAQCIPRGWVYQNIVAGVSRDAEATAGLDPDHQIVFPDKIDAIGGKDGPIFSQSPYTFIALIMVPNFPRALRTTAFNQTLIHQALIACTLERYHLAHGEYPEKLDSLIPQFITAIPHDVIGGQPPHYRRAADGTFILYSIGWTGRDGGGVPGKSNEEGDWVWPN
jgi:hypothetical protein